MKGVVAAGHPLTAEAGAQVLRAGGNAVDAALAAMAASFVAEPQLTGLGAGGYMLVAEPGAEPALLDFFVAAPGDGADPSARAPLVAAEVFFGTVAQVFHVGAAACGVYGTPAGICEAHRRYASVPLPDLLAPAAALARKGVEVNAQQAYIFDLLAPLTEPSPEAREKYWIGDRVAREGDVLRDPEMADTLDRLGAEGAAPFYTGDIAAAAVERVTEGGGMLTLADLAAYEAIPREPIRVGYRGHDVFTNPPPSAGGILIAYVLALLDREPGPPSQARLVAAMESAQRARTPAFLEGLGAARLPRRVHGLAPRLDDAHLGARRRRARVRGDVHERRGLGRDRARHRHPPQQHDGRGGPLAARLLHPPAGAAAAVDDGADRGGARRRGDAGARVGGLQPHPLGDPAGDPRRDRPRAQPRRGGRGAARALGGRDGLRGARRATPTRSPPTGWELAEFDSTSTCSSGAPRRCGATRRRARWRAPATRAAAARSSRLNPRSRGSDP